MDATETRLPPEMSRSTRGKVACPICGGPMIVLRDECRCCQCNFRMCESCEGDHEPDS
jgi:hypothetical protein